MQNKSEKIQFIVFWHVGNIEESSLGEGGNCPSIDRVNDYLIVGDNCRLKVSGCRLIIR